MAVRAFCQKPQELLEKIKAAIRSGTIQTWEMDSDGDLTHAPQQWKFKAWFSPSVETGQLVFKILGQQTERMSTTVYAVYHGRLIEMLLTHFDEDITRASATAQIISGENVGGGKEDAVVSP
jgi:hypothetical protein